MSAGMNFSSGIRSVRFPGFALALLLISACARTDGADRNVTADVGAAVVLPCECPVDPHASQYLVWQKDGDRPLLVNYRPAETNTEAAAAEYLNRTELEPAGGCSLRILRVRPADQGLYKCYYQKSPLRHHNIYLEVREKQGIQGRTPISATVVSSAVCGTLIALLTLAAVCVGLTRRRRRQTNGTFVASPTGAFGSCQ